MSDLIESAHRVLGHVKIAEFTAARTMDLQPAERGAQILVMLTDLRRICEAVLTPSPSRVCRWASTKVSNSLRSGGAEPTNYHASCGRIFTEKAGTFCPGCGGAIQERGGEG